MKIYIYDTYNLKDLVLLRRDFFECLLSSIGKRRPLFIIALALLSIVSISSCKKFIAVDAPSTSISSGNVFNDDGTAAAVLTGIYTTISQSNNFSGSFSSITAMSYYPALSADELTLFNGASNATLIAYYQNALTINNTSGSDFWPACYSIIYIANSAIGGLQASTQLTPAVKQQLLGEAYFVRAFCYFYLINLYGDVPLATGTDYTVNAALPRTPKAQVYAQIIDDLKQAKNLLNTNYVDASVIKTTTERVRPNKAVATAMLARTYLYTGDYANAETQATAVISNSSYDTVSLNNVFLKNSKETVWALQPVLGTVAQNTGDGRLFILPSTGPSATVNPVYLSTSLLSSFESGDKRNSNWISSVTVSGTTYSYVYKYKIGSVNTSTAEYLMVLRLGEQYLIRAEAKAQQNNLIGAAADLNLIRKRAGLGNTTASSQSDLLSAIAHERQVELFTEWGHRWLDLKRTGKADAVMSVVTPLKGGTWDSRWALYPIPTSDISTDPNLQQNPGY